MSADEAAAFDLAAVRLQLLGCGKMGGAMLHGWLDRGLAPAHVTLIEPSAAAAAPFVSRGATHVVDTATLPVQDRLDVAVLAIKPQMMAEVLPAYRAQLPEGCLILSIAAGTTLARLAEHLGGEHAIIRAMPNTPAAIRQGVSVLCANARVSATQRRLASALLAAVGAVHWLDDEEQLHAVTGLSGSGPAYVFHLIEAMAAAGVAAGLPKTLAAALARATVTGAAALAAQDADTTPEQLRRNVTSPGGTTQAGLEVLMRRDTGLTPLLGATVAAAAKRSRELA